MIRKVLILVCDNCGQQEPTECQTVKDAVTAGKEIGWRMRSDESLCRYCRQIAEEIGQ